MTTPFDPEEFARQQKAATKAGRWTQRLATVQLWLYVGPLVLAGLAILGCCGYATFR